jgi:hypothetical protein
MRWLICLTLAAGLAACSSTGAISSQPPTSPSIPPAATSSAAPVSQSPAADPSPQPSATSTGIAGRGLCNTKHAPGTNAPVRLVTSSTDAVGDHLQLHFCTPAVPRAMTTSPAKTLTLDPSGKPSELKGSSLYLLRLFPAEVTGSAHAVPVKGVNLTAYQLLGSFEGVVTYGISLRHDAGVVATGSYPEADKRHFVVDVVIVQ